MQKLGPLLREAREGQGITLEEAADATRIRAQFLELLEAGDFAAFPGGDVQVRGFLRIYARHLDLSAEEVLGRYSTEVHGAETPIVEAAPVSTQGETVETTDDLTSVRFRPRDIPVTSSLPRWMSLETVLIVGIVLTALLVMLAIVSYVMNQPENSVSLPSVAPGTPTAVDLSRGLAARAGGGAGGGTLALDFVKDTLEHVLEGTSVLLEGIITREQVRTPAGNGAILAIPNRESGLQVAIDSTDGER